MQKSWGRRENRIDGDFSFIHINAQNGNSGMKALNGQTNTRWQKFKGNKVTAPIIWNDYRQAAASSANGANGLGRAVEFQTPDPLQQSVMFSNIKTSRLTDLFTDANQQWKATFWVKVTSDTAEPRIKMAFSTATKLKGSGDCCGIEEAFRNSWDLTADGQWHKLEWIFDGMDLDAFNEFTTDVDVTSSPVEGSNDVTALEQVANSIRISPLTAGMVFEVDNVVVAPYTGEAE